MRKFRFIYLLAPFAYSVVCYLSLVPQNFKCPVSLGLLQPDKAVHAAMYFTVSLMSIIEMSKLGKLKSPKGVIFWALLVPVFFGGLIEILQNFIPNRSCDIYDFIANSIGAILAYVLYRALLVRLSWISPDRSPSPDRDRESR